MDIEVEKNLSIFQEVVREAVCCGSKRTCKGCMDIPTKIVDNKIGLHVHVQTKAESVQYLCAKLA